MLLCHPDSASPRLAHGSMDQKMADQAKLALLLCNVEQDSFPNGYLETPGYVAAPQGYNEQYYYLVAPQPLHKQVPLLLVLPPGTHHPQVLNLFFSVESFSAPASLCSRPK